MRGIGSRKLGIILHIPLIILIVWAVYLNSLNNSFHFDDYHSIVNNKSIRALKNIPDFFSDPSTFSDTPWMKMYRPVLLISYALNYAIGGLNVTGFHIVNILIHSVNAVILYLIAKVFLKGWAPLIASLFFGFLPLNTQAVNYISSRSVLLVTFFYLLAFYLYVRSGVRSQQNEISVHRSRFTIYYLLSFISYALALLTKEIAITLFLTLLLYDYLLKNKLEVRGERLEVEEGQRLKGKGERAGKVLFFTVYSFLWRHLPFWIITAGYLFLRRSLFGQATIKISKATLIEGEGVSRSIHTNIFTQSKAIVIYLRETFFPVGLSIIHDIKKASGLFEFWVVVSLLIIASLILLGLRLKNRYPLFTFGILWFFVALLPETILPLNLIVNEHRAYLPGVGVALCVGLSFQELVNWSKLSSSLLRNAIVTVFILFLATSAIVTIHRNTVWRDSYTLWSDAAEKAPNSPRVHFSLGGAYNSRGDYDSAIAEFEKAITLAPSYYRPYRELGNAYFKKGEHEKALRNFNIALQLKPEDATIYYNLGIAYAKMEQYLDAEDAFRKAVIIRPDYSDAYVGIGRIMELKGDSGKAYEAYKKAILYDPLHDDANRKLRELILE